MEANVIDKTFRAGKRCQIVDAAHNITRDIHLHKFRSMGQRRLTEVG